MDGGTGLAKDEYALSEASSLERPLAIEAPTCLGLY